MGKRKHQLAPFQCGKCAKGFDSQNAAQAHARDAHKGAKAIGVYQKVSTVQGIEYDDEPSFADRAIEAQMAVDAGLYTDDDWLLP